MSWIRSVGGLACILALSACGHSTGRQVQPNHPKHNLQVVNTSPETKWVYVGHGPGTKTVTAASKGHIGKVHPYSVGYFKIEKGKQRIYLRDRGESLLHKKVRSLEFRTGRIHRIYDDHTVVTLSREEARQRPPILVPSPLPPPPPPPGVETPPFTDS